MLHSTDIFLALLILGATAALEVEITPTQGEISVGESKIFLCEVIGVAKQIDWFSPSGDRIEPNKPDITVTLSDGPSSTLTLYNAGVDNAGTYKCVATNGDQQAESTVNVKIYQKITFKNAPSPQEFTEGDNANIVCDVISSPPPTVIWKHKGAKIQMEKDIRFKILSNSHLQIRGIKKTDEGMYTCEGRVMARGEIDFRAIRVVINVLPTIRVWQAEVNATADVEQSAMLSCAADGYPEPMVTWARNGVVLESEQKYGFNEDGSEMTIMDVQKLDEGEYTCIAKNKAGESEQELSLRVFVKPKITYLVNQSTSEKEEQVTLTCEASGDPTPAINWSSSLRNFTEGEQASWTRPEQHKSLDGNVVVRSDARVSSLTLKYVTFTDAGQYLCTAINAIGQDSRLVNLEVRYAPKIQGSVTVYTWEGNAANISCEVLAHPSDVSMLWLRDGLQLPNPNTTNIRLFNGPSTSYLEVTPESENDFGSYNCTASNEMGTESKEFLLIQADVPSAPSVGQVEAFSSSARVEFQEPDATGGVPVLKYRAQWKTLGRASWAQQIYEVQDGALSDVTIIGLKPETNYEVKMSAINGKGEGEGSPAVVFKTEPVREPNPPKLEGTLQPKGNFLKVNWIKQDDGGSPITHYLVRYKPKLMSEWKPEIRVPSGSEHVVLSSLEWDTEYDVFVVAENEQGKSKPGILTFRTSPEPAAIPDIEEETALSTSIIAGILIVAFVLLLLAVDVTCFFVNKCGLIMCLCGKPGSGTKGHTLEEGKAAFIKDESKEPIVEVRTEDECTANHNAAGPTEPNETTPLTEPELAAHTAALALDTLSSVATNSDTANTTFDPAQDSPSSETTTLTCSFSTPVTDPLPAPAPAYTPESHPAPPAPLVSTPEITGKGAPLVDFGVNGARAEASYMVNAIERPKSQKSPAPIAPKRRNSPKLKAVSPPTSSPTSALATASHTPVTKKRAPIDPDMPAPAPTAATLLGTDTSAPTASSTFAKDTPTPALTAPTTTSTPVSVHVAPTALDADITAPVVQDTNKPAQLAPEMFIPFPTATSAPTSAPTALTATSLDTPAATDTTPSASAAYDTPAPTLSLTACMPATAEPKAPEIDLELTNGALSPSLPPAEPTRLESRPTLTPSLPNGDGTDPLEELDSLAKAPPPVNDEKIIGDEKSKADEAEVKTALSEVTAGHNDVAHTNASESKA